MVACFTFLGSEITVGGDYSHGIKGAFSLEGNVSPRQYSCLENPMDRGAWQATVYGVAKSQTRLSDSTSLHLTSLLGRKAMTNLDRVKSRDFTLPTTVHLVKAMAFPAVMCGCESWTKRRLSTKELMPLNCDAGEDS